MSGSSRMINQCVWDALSAQSVSVALWGFNEWGLWGWGRRGTACQSKEEVRSFVLGVRVRVSVRCV